MKEIGAFNNVKKLRHISQKKPHKKTISTKNRNGFLNYFLLIGIFFKNTGCSMPPKTKSIIHRVN